MSIYDVFSGGNRPFDKEEWAAAKQAQRKEAYELIDNTCSEMMASGDSFRQYLNVQGSFDRYSVANAILVSAQMPEATQLKEYSKWKANRVYVNKDAQKIIILEPSKEYTREDGTKGISYNAKVVYDISETSAKDRQQEQEPKSMRELVSALIDASPVPCVPVGELELPAYYDSSQQTIFVKKGLSEEVLFVSMAKEVSAAVYDFKYNESRDASDFKSYICGRNKQERGHHCDYKASLRKTDIEPLVIEAVKELVSDKYFAKEIEKRIVVQTDTTAIDKELANYESKLKEVDLNKARLEREIDNLPVDTRFRERKIHDMTLRLDALYDTIVELEERIEDAKLRKSSIEMETITLDNIYKLMLNFGKLYDIISDEEKKSLITYLIKEIQIYPNGESEKPLKSIEFNFPIYRDGQEVRRLLWEKGNTVETVVLLSKGEIDSKKVRVEFSLEDMDMSEFQDGATYPQIKEYVLEHTGLKVSNLYISQIKRKCGLEVGKNYNLPKSEDSRQPQCPPEKEKAIREAFKYFGMI